MSCVARQGSVLTSLEVPSGTWDSFYLFQLLLLCSLCKSHVSLKEAALYEERDHFWYQHYPQTPPAAGGPPAMPHEAVSLVLGLRCSWKLGHFCLGMAASRWSKAALQSSSQTSAGNLWDHSNETKRGSAKQLPKTPFKKDLRAFNRADGCISDPTVPRAGNGAPQPTQRESLRHVQAGGFPTFPGCSSLPAAVLRPKEEQGREGMRNLQLRLGKQVGAELKAGG